MIIFYHHRKKARVCARVAFPPARWGWAALLLISLSSFAQQKDYSIQAVNFTKVKLTDNFWLPRLKTNHTVTIPASFERCDKTGRVKNFEMAATHTGQFCTKFPFDD